MNPSLAHLKKLAVCSDTLDAEPDLRAHLLAHAEVYAPLLGAASTATFCTVIAAVEAGDLASRVLVTVAEVSKRTADARYDKSARERDAAAGRVAATIAKAFLTWTLDREALRDASRATVQEARVRFLASRGAAYEVDGGRLHAILTLRKDARPVLYPLSDRPLVVHWGARGQMTFTNLNETVPRASAPRALPAQCIHLPMIERLDGKIDTRELEQAAE